jgi:hypothetical protein
MNPNPNSEKKDNLEINLNQPSSPLVPLHIRNFVKEINVPVEMKIQTNDRENMETMTGGSSTTDNGIFGYFKSFFQGFSQQSLHKKKHDTQNKSYLNSLFYSGNEEKTKEPNIDNVSSEEKTKEPNIDNVSSEEKTKEPNIDNVSSEEKEEPNIDNVSSEEKTKEPNIDNVSSEEKEEPVDNVSSEEKTKEPNIDNVSSEEKEESVDNVSSE